MRTIHLVLGLIIFIKLDYFVVCYTLLFGIVLVELRLVALHIGNIHAEVLVRTLYIVQERVVSLIVISSFFYFTTGYD